MSSSRQTKEASSIQPTTRRMFLNKPQKDSQKGDSDASKRRILTNDDAKEQQHGSCLSIMLLKIFLAICVFNILINVILYFAPMEDPQLVIKTSPQRPRPKFEGPLAMNEQLDEAELLFENHFHAPESFAWRRSSNRTFFTGVEGGFILEVNPFARTWHVVAQLNSPQSDVLDEADSATWIGELYSPNSPPPPPPQQHNASAFDQRQKQQKYCLRDVELYGESAKSKPAAVPLSRCSRPLGVRLAPDESYLYVVDPFSGLYRIDLVNSYAGATTTRRLIDFARFDVRFADDLAVRWNSASGGQGDTIYISDCSRRWTLRYLIRMMIEYDDSGRILEFDTQFRELKPLSSGARGGSLKPVKIRRSEQLAASSSSRNDRTKEEKDQQEEEEDWRNLSFPNGVELTANGSALLVSDLNNRRILMHHIEGPLRGQTRHLLWVPGYSDNIKRGLDASPDGRPTYWLACGCAVSDGPLEIAEFMNHFPLMRALGLKLSHYVGCSIEWLGHLFGSSSLEDAGFEIKSLWLKKDPYCTHGLVMQFDEFGRVLRTLHAPHFSSSLKLVSEAHEVPDSEYAAGTSNSPISHLFIGSVYYSYLGHLELKSAPSERVSR